jgi:uncharacterized protein (DUF2147 family)
MRINATALTAAALAAAFVSAGTARAAESPLGVWIDHTGRGAVEITDCNGKLCGYVAWVKDSKDANGCGEQIIGDVKPVGSGKWDNGWIYDPDSDSKYDVELTPKGDTLRVVGYAGTKWLSETMTWKRAPADLQKCSKSDAAAAAPAAKPETTTAAKPAGEVKAAVNPETKTEAKPQAAAKPQTEAKTETKAPEAEPDKQAAAPANEDTAAAESDEAEDEADEPKKKGGGAIAALAEALDDAKLVRRSNGTCRVQVPYADMVVTFPCDGKKDD